MALSFFSLHKVMMATLPRTSRVTAFSGSRPDMVRMFFWLLGDRGGDVMSMSMSSSFFGRGISWWWWLLVAQEEEREVVLVVRSGCQVTQSSLHDAVKNHEIGLLEGKSQLVPGRRLNWVSDRVLCA